MALPGPRGQINESCRSFRDEKLFSPRWHSAKMGLIDGDLVANPGNVVMLDTPDQCKVIEVVQNGAVSFTQHLTGLPNASQ